MRASRRQGASITGAIGSLVDSHLKDRAGLDRIRELSLVAAATAALIHELQKERGLSSGHVAGAGRRFSRDLSDQKARTDRAQAAAAEAWVAIGPSPRFGALEAAMGEARAALVDLSQYRTDIQAQALTPNAVVQKFSGLVDRLLVVIAEVPGTSPHPQVTMALIALFNFLLAKEYTGQVRALGSAVCAQGGFEPFQFDRFRTLLLQRDEVLGTFGRHASRDQLDRWSEAQASESFSQWDQLRRNLERSGLEGQGRLPDAEEWYRWATAAIDTMRGVETGLLDGLGELCRHILAETRSAWEDGQESPEDRDGTLKARLERTQVRLWEERRDLRNREEGPGPARQTAPADPVTGLVEASAAAAEELHRWRRDLDRWDAAVRDASDRARQAAILALDARIPAFRRPEIAAEAQNLSEGLKELAASLEARMTGLKTAADRAVKAQEVWHDQALALRRDHLKKGTNP